MRVEVLGGLERRRRWSQDDKARIVGETLAPGAKVTEVARRNVRRVVGEGVKSCPRAGCGRSACPVRVAASVVFTWRRQARTAERVVPSPLQTPTLSESSSRENKRPPEGGLFTSGSQVI